MANVMLNAHMDGIRPFDSIDVLSELTSSDVLDFIRSELNSDRLVLSVVERKVD